MHAVVISVKRVFRSFAVSQPLQTGCVVQVSAISHSSRVESELIQLLLGLMRICGRSTSALPFLSISTFGICKVGMKPLGLSDGRREQGPNISMRWMAEASRLVKASGWLLPSLTAHHPSQPAPTSAHLQPPTGTPVRRKRAHAFAQVHSYITRCCCRRETQTAHFSPSCTIAPH